MFITFEGIEGCGKTTQIELLDNYLTEKGHRVLKTREPGGTQFGEILREALLRRGMNVRPLAELFVFMAMRAQHVEEVILPAIQDGRIILCDRFADATYAYQGYGRNIDLTVIDTLNTVVTHGLQPDLTFLINLPVETGLRRRAASSEMDRIENEEISFHRKIGNAYEKMAKENPKRFFVIDGSLKIPAIQEIIRTKVDGLLKTYGI